MKDGLYQVTTNYLCAGFVIEGGKLTHCAPILLRNFLFYKTLAVFIK